MVCIRYSQLIGFIVKYHQFLGKKIQHIGEKKVEKRNVSLPRIVKETNRHVPIKTKGKGGRPVTIEAVGRGQKISAPPIIINVSGDSENINNKVVPTLQSVEVRLQRLDRSLVANLEGLNGKQVGASGVISDGAETENKSDDSGSDSDVESESEEGSCVLLQKRRPSNIQSEMVSSPSILDYLNVFCYPL